MSPSLSQLTASELSEIDALCLQFERDLRSLHRRDAWSGEFVDGKIAEVAESYRGPHRSALVSELRATADELSRRLPESGSHASLFESPRPKSDDVAVQGTGEPSDGDRRSDWLQPGMRIGPYLVDQCIGRGGMGEVYRGRDTRLDRDVAIKVLVEDAGAGPELNQRFERFDRETRAVAGLSHPSIVSLYDVGQHAGRPFAVMELLRGETLRDRLRRSGSLDPRVVRYIGGEAADALATAHRAGIIHRDLKPENLFLTDDGRVKLLDFGLSRTHAHEDQPTATGVILGTMGYLSPEQANGQSIGPAADLFSLGCVLHECFYGTQPFRGSTIAESLASILNGTPETDPLRAKLDPELAQLIANCLIKDPAARPFDADTLACRMRGSSTGRTCREGSILLGDQAGNRVSVEGQHEVDGPQPPPWHDRANAVTRAALASGAAPSDDTDERSDSPKALANPAEPITPTSPTSPDSNHPLTNGEKGRISASGFSGVLQRRRLLQLMGWTAAVVVAAVAAAEVTRWANRPPQIRSLAVLPLEDETPETPPEVAAMRTRPLSTGEQLSAAIADQLSRIPDLRVYPYLPLRELRTRSGRLASGEGSSESSVGTSNDLENGAVGESAVGDRAGDSDTTQTPARPGSSGAFSGGSDQYREIAQRLGVDALLVGTTSTDSDGYQTITVQVIDGQTGAQIVRYPTRVEAATNLIDQQETAARVAEKIGRELAFYQQGRPRSNSTYHCLVNGYARMDPESTDALADALACFRNAVAQDQKFGEAYAGLALTAMMLLERAEVDQRTGFVEQARGALEHLDELEASLVGRSAGDPAGSDRKNWQHATLARAMMAWQVDWDFPRADQQFTEALAGMPDSWVAHYEYSAFLAAQGQFEEARARARRATQLDSMSVAFKLQAARWAWLAGYERTALEEIQAVRSAFDGTSRDAAIGLELDILEARGDLDRAGQLLCEQLKKTWQPGADYWQLREDTLQRFPYGPYGPQLNAAILHLRRGAEVDEGWLLRLKSDRPARLPLLVSSHPAFVAVRHRSSLRELVVQPILAM